MPFRPTENELESFVKWQFLENSKQFMDASCWGAISSTLIIPFRKPLNSNHISLDTFWYPGPPPIFPHHYCFRLQCHNFPKLPLSRISTSFTFLNNFSTFPFFLISVFFFTNNYHFCETRQAVLDLMENGYHWEKQSLLGHCENVKKMFAFVILKISAAGIFCLLWMWKKLIYY